MLEKVEGSLACVGRKARAGSLAGRQARQVLGWELLSPLAARAVVVG